MNDEKIISFDEYLNEGWFERQWARYKAGEDARSIKKLAKMHTKILHIEQKAKQNKYRYEAVRFNYEHIKMNVLDAKKLINKLRYKKGISQELVQAMDKLDIELDRLNDFAVEGLHELMIQHKL
ncbi:hypothetical protein KVP40.0305 [Vibrio phage KVP40]|uniref:Uncharacterized protein n=1 Tax=Vibrio phage KVP40 (isolate Vibrio parahaemolyticus/Japan/Matsuzaki/1991) TaxID=75320 RepID=Q6WHJ8_BPKVM|nr:hypothetical protein KVP40.0305 [Vibrio phage KVP40]AAQ64375.1 hypothetical protein KVP40.0305 [Vibrio phage KVP40]